MTTETWIHLLGLFGAAIGATWTLRAKLSNIETAISSHVASDKAQFESLDHRIVKLERRSR